ncbi:MAG: hypothetical protein LUE98_00470 [Tannerellaceae bacterium]|nr:hypothetical protein [Tannerellaceae bacterium]
MKSLQPAIRALLKFRFYTGINIIGLGLSLACCILLFRYIYSELTTDLCFSYPEQLYITTKQQPVQNCPEVFPGYVPFIDFPVLPLEDMAVRIATSFVSLPEAIISVNERVYNVHALAVDTFFSASIGLSLYRGEL